MILNLLALRRRPLSVGEIVQAVDVGQPTVSHHLKVLLGTGFVLSAQRGTSSFFRVNERCVQRFPSAAELIMGLIPVEPEAATCPPPWLRSPKSRRGPRKRRSRSGSSGVSARV
jgi:hypothetical protein